MCYSEPLATPSATEPLCYSMRCYSSDTARYSECDVTPELSSPHALEFNQRLSSPVTMVGA